MRKHPSYPRNNNIANVFFKAGFVESWERGFKKIAEEFERAHLPLPTIEENGGVTATIQRKTVSENSETCRKQNSLNVNKLLYTPSSQIRTLQASKCRKHCR